MARKRTPFDPRRQGKGSAHAAPGDVCAKLAVDDARREAKRLAVTARVQKAILAGESPAAIARLKELCERPRQSKRRRARRGKPPSE